jgi:sugar phosphate isomerase/epimerase
MNIGLQLYGLRDSLAQDYAGSIARVAKMGLDGVEGFGDFVSPKENKRLLDDHGLKVAGYHFVIQQLEADVQACIDKALEVGAPTLVCAWAIAEQRGWEAVADSLENIAQACAKHGLPFAYHNHQHELLETVNGKPALDVIAERAPSVQFEMDIAWLHVGQVSPSGYLRKYANRTVLIHVKDVIMKGPNSLDTVELGVGDVNLAGAVAAAKQTASPWLLAEQDNSDDPWRSTERNIAWLKQNAQ